LLGTLLNAVSTPLVCYFLLRLLVAVPKRTSSLHPILERLALPLTAAYAVSFLWALAAYFWPSLDVAFGGLSLTLRTQWFAELLLVIAILVAIIDGLVYSERADRVPMQWIASTVIVFAVLEATRAVSFLAIGSSPRWLETIAFPIETVVVLGTAYAVLRHRAIDLEFVLSRAAVFAAVSAVVVTIFVAAEWVIAMLGDKLLAASHPGVTLERFSGLLAALVAGLLARPVHGSIERLLNRIFFARQHRDEEALRRFAREAEVATDSEELLASTFEIARKHVEGSSVSILVRSGAAYRCRHTTRSSAPGAISENDPVALRLRRFGEPFELNDVEHEYHHAMFFPMTMVGRLVAIIVCGPKVDRTHYGEREIESLSQFAHRVGTAYAWLAETATHGATSDLNQAAARNSTRKITST
ncbi:MAG TPA: hypothetical protein VK760_09370, partial [Candidatus Acidoferrales bacterium]|nr:hypothetical protein [Candidatus Acidoferrales bacterium]